MTCHQYTHFVFSLLPVLCLSVDIIYHVKEEKSSNTFVGDIAKDARLHDSGHQDNHRMITFTQIVGRLTTSQLFNVTQGGKLFTTQRLDAESLCTYNSDCFRIIKVVVHRMKTFMKILKIKVIIEDINDHKPQFPSEMIDLMFSETDGKGTTKSIPNAIDKDVGAQNSQIIYRLEKTIDLPFSLSVSKRLDGTAKLDLVLVGKLDRESKDLYNVAIIATDEGFHPMLSKLNVQITIMDANDNLPSFTQSIYNISIRKIHKNDKPIVTLSATDQDSGKNGQITYHFSSKTYDIAKNHFRLNSTTGEVTLHEKFHFDDKSSYKIFVEATDKGSPALSSLAILQLNIINQENNPPLIDVDFILRSSENETTVAEDADAGSFIAYVIVTDDDFDNNGKVTCKLQHEKFKLVKLQENEYKIIVQKRVDREVKEKHAVTITCEDKGIPPLRTHKNMVIAVLDVNDVKPQFTKKIFNFLTYENEKPNFPIGFINASDPDLGDGGRLTYSLIPGKTKYNLPFHITDYGFISTSKTLDREQQNTYEFLVFVKDNGIPSLNNTANVIVKVLDENDNAPYFTFPSVNPFRLDVHYHPQSKNDITVLRASDRDSKKNAFLKYEILSGNNKQLFAVNPYTGVLTFSRTVYQNDAGSYELEFAVKDSGTPVLSATTSVSLTLTVSNKTSLMSTAVQSQSDNTIDVTFLIIIVAVTVIVSVAIVIAITLCIVRCNNVRNGSVRRTEDKQTYQSRNEIGQLIYQTNSPVVLKGNQEEIIHRNTSSMRSQNQFCPEEGLEKEWQTTAMIRALPPNTQYSQPVRVTSYGEHEEQNVVLAPSFLNDSLLTDMDSRCDWTERNLGLYEEIPR
ncbi:protocadherin beta-18 isoform X1 [Octopus vulgaris]|uniref:Protocadherin beta-18 isoform X1 n=1 Tax=Octopus vulgaris TaxID=6645 RepID=A0AA36BGD5_OCTVU|nr:protocadherin beta-18 isoform X1 [Octopus vulgaris]